MRGVGNGKMLKRPGPKIDANGKMVKLTRDNVVKLVNSETGNMVKLVGARKW